MYAESSLQPQQLHAMVRAWPHSKSASRTASQCCKLVESKQEVQCHPAIQTIYGNCIQFVLLTILWLHAKPISTMVWPCKSQRAYGSCNPPC